MNQSTKLIKNLSKEIKSDKFCYRKVGRAITKWGAIEKSSILLLQYWKIYLFLLLEARDRSIKAIAFAKLLRKDLEVAAEYKLTADPRKLLNMLHMTGHVQVSMGI